MGHTVTYIALFCIFAISYSNGCDMSPPGTLWLPQSITIKDIFKGVMFTTETINIAGIVSITPNQNLNGGPYFAGSLQGSTFTLSTTDAFEDYEEHETIDNPNLNILFNCVGGTTRSLTFIISITDTNNNAPRFLTENNELEFTIVPPLPPGFSITGCFNEITVRDIDLTTERIDFEIFDTSLFEISYDAALSTVPKEFKATLRTTTFIRSLPEPLEFIISATDVDRTSDPPLTVNTTVRIKSLDGGFELPDEPVFSQAYYLATYTKDHSVILEEKISLEQGYTDNVKFSLDQDTLENFAIRNNGNNILLEVVTPLSSNNFIQRQIRLVITAELENTSGANAVIIVELPEVEELKFSQPVYEGTIVDNILQHVQLELSQGYEGNEVSVEILDYADFFQVKLDNNIITLTMTPLDSNIIEENTFLNLRVVAATNQTSVMAVVTLKIIKDDTVTPVFSRAVYEGLYNTTEGLILEPIVLVQGYDETVSVTLQGEHVSYFKLDEAGQTINLRLDVDSLPTDLFNEQSLILYLRATKPRTVGATAAISIALPAESQLEFEQAYYKGFIEDNVLHLSELTLSKGYEEDDVTVTINSNYASFFNADIDLNKITLSMSPLDSATIEDNSFLNLEIVAVSSRSTASTVVTLEIVKDDTLTPVFERAVYEGSYDLIDGLILEEIMLTQGYDDTVQISLLGEHSGYFQVVRSGPLINLTVSSLPSELFPEQNIILSIEVSKPRTVGASTAISIALPEETQLEFEQPNYKGFIKDNELQLSQLILSQGYDNDPVSISINNDYASYFDAEIEGNKITLSMSSLDSNVIEKNTFINVHVIASTNRSSAITIATLEIIKNDTLTPVFERALYEGTYDPKDGLKLEDIALVQGYDETVNLFLRGEHASLFIFQEGPVISLELEDSTLPDDLLSMSSLLLTIEATKPRTVGASAAISIALPEARSLEFEVDTYTGTIQENLLQLENIILSEGYDEDVVFTLTGEYASYFNVTNVQNEISVNLQSSIPSSVIEENNFLLLSLSASALNALTASTTIAIEVVKEDLTTPLFSQNIYHGTYAGPSSLNIATITLSQGFDNTVSFQLVGEHSQYFKTSVSTAGAVSLELQTAIPEDVIFNEKVLLFSILAEKELTVGANAAVSIHFPRELTEPSVLRFARNIYIGSLQQNDLSLEDVVLEIGYETGTHFELFGDFSEYFTLTSTNNIVKISSTSALPTEIFKSKFISLEVEASRNRAVSVSTTIIIDIEQLATVEPPVFTEAYYRGVYTQENELHFEDEISLAQGFDNTVTFTLDGASSQWFDVKQENNLVSIVKINEIPTEVLEANNNLLFSILAQKPNATDGRAAILIDLLKDITDVVLRFDQISYTGSIENNNIALSPILLSTGPSTGVTFTLNGELSDFFGVTSQGSNVLVALQAPIPPASLPSNRLIVLEMQASAPQAAPAYATLVLHVVVEDEPTPVVPALVFDATYYVGRYTANDGLSLSTPITLAEGFGSDVVFALEGDQSQWFTVTNSGNTVNLELSSPIPPPVIANNQKLIFVILAQRPGSEDARATVVISLTDESDIEEVLGFYRLSYTGSIENNIVTTIPIVLSQGSTAGVSFSLHGDLSDFFGVTSQGSNVLVALQAPIPPASLPSNRLIVLEMQASAPQAAPAYATLVLHVVVEDEPTPVVPALVFDAIYYVGGYTANDGLSLSTPITLAEGFGSDVVFALEGDQSQWFTVTNSGNTVNLVLSSPIPPPVIANNQKLIFVILAQRPGSEDARATVVISLTDESDIEEVLGFDRLSYTGSIENNIVTTIPIVLSQGSTAGVSFSLHGELSDFFGVTSQGSNVLVALQAPIPTASIPSNRLIVLEMQASAPQAAPAYATLVLHVVVEDEPTPVVPALVFDATYYVGGYTANDGLSLSTPITLAEGFGSDVVFALEGDQSQWFTVTNSGNTVNLVLSSPIPPPVIANNQKLIFVILAQRPGSEDARATVVISLTDESDIEEVLGFDRLSYTGSIENNIVTTIPIVLSQGSTAGVSFSLHGELSDFFGVTSQGSNVLVALQAPIPTASIPSNRLIVLEMQASAPQAAPAYATLVLHVVVEDEPTPVVPALVFDATYYVGGYTANDGLSLSTPITLAEGFGSDVVFALEGDQSQWFTVTNSGNTVNLVLSSPIPPPVIANNQKLIFVILAQRPGSEDARATVVISLTDESDIEEVLGFDRLSYTGSIENNIVTTIPIVLSQGSTAGVSFSLHGELSDFFGVTSQGSNVLVALQAPIPTASIPSNRLIVLEMQASAPQAAPAYATLVLHVVVEDEPTPVVPALVFDATYYVGGYTANDGLSLSTPITLAEGFGSDVVFALEGDQSQWFTVTNSGNTVNLVLSSPIPPPVIANNQKLIFVILAQRPGSEDARATVVISLTDESDIEEVLGFDRLSYTGSIENNIVTTIPIVLSQGSTAGVSFSLHGELSDFFGVTSQGSNVLVALQAPIPPASLPSNRLIVLEMQASAPQAAPAYATLVLHVVVEDEPTPVVPALVFDAIYYVGGYTANDGLSLSTPITLAEGFGSDVVFALEGDQSQWFTVTNSGNTVNLVLSSPIPPPVIANNQKLIFVILAQRPGSEDARATVVISLTDESDIEEVLGFDRLSYTGSIENNIVTTIPIVLSQGSTAGVSFSLHGELSDFFGVTSQGSNVLVALQAPIPPASLPSNRLIILEMQASAPQAAPAYATLVLHVVVEDEPTPVVPALVFDATYYVGRYTANDGLSLSTPITLAEGFGSDVVFALEGDQSQWFTVTNSGNTVNLVLSSPIPPPVIANNQKLIFVILAQRPGSEDARATVVISLTDESDIEEVLGFDRLSYTGSIENNIVTTIPIVLSQGSTAGVSFSLHGELSDFFGVTSQGTNVLVSLQAPIPAASIPTNRLIVLEMQASAPQAAPAYATLVLHVVVEDEPTPVVPALVFDATYYVGGYTANDGLSLSTPITLAEGFGSDVVFALEGDQSQWFTVTNSGNTVNLVLSSPIPPPVIANNQKLIFVILAQRPGSEDARATVVISLTDDGQDSSVSFDKVLYDGIIQDSAVHHEVIKVIGYDGNDISIVGALSSSFKATLSEGTVVVQSSGSLTLPPNINHVVLELRVADTGAVLILQVSSTEEQPTPVVSFEQSYAITVGNRHTGPVGRVQASADNGEAVAYSLQVDNDHLQTRLTVSSDGELRLSAPAIIGVYSFQAIATTIFTQASGQTTVQLTVEKEIDGPITCGDDNITLEPLIIINRDEEEEYRDLVPLNESEFPGCHYTLTNHWPIDQNWLYVDDSGLHTTAIDREDKRIAFMALSQVQVELNLVCEGDASKTKRSLDKRLDWLGSYDYGSNKWILTESISFNPRRSIVNLIVNDINDNDPIFLGIENQPIVVGYPILELEDKIMPRSLAELQATDADVGVNAELLYWSDEPEIAVSPTTGFVHVRTNAQLEENMILTVNATDQNGEGRTGSIALMVKLLDTANIAVVTIRDAFLEDEGRVLGNLSNAIGYEVRALRSVVVSTTSEEETTRRKRDTTITPGTSLEIYVYGLIQKEPVSVETLSNDINSAAVIAVDIASILSLEDHLEGNQICAIPGRDIGLLVATIVLSILLFILIVAAVVWYLLTRKKQENYEQFSDANSLASQNESLGRPAKPDFVAKPRLNIEELKKSEKRLQDMLNAPVEDINVGPTPSTSNKNTLPETKIPLPDPLAAIVINDKLKDAEEDSDEDEFGERKNARRKSVVTFNENVEKIIHVDDDPEEVPEQEVYKF